MSVDIFSVEEKFAAKMRRECFFGIGEALLGAGSFLFGGGLSGSIAGGLGSLGVGASTAGTLGSIGAGALEGAGFGAATSAIGGGNPLTGAEFGGLTGGALGGVSSALGGLAGPSGAATTPAAGAGAAAIAPAPGVLPSAPIDPTSVLAQTGAAPSALSGAAGVPTASGSATGLGSLGPAPSAGGATSVQQFFQNPSFGNAWNAVSANPQAVVGALGLGYDTLNQGNVKGLNALKGEAQSLQQQGQALSGYVNSGTLPQGEQAALTQATNAAKAEIRSKYAALGLSGSTQEAQDLAYQDVNAAAAQGQIANQLLQTGLSESGMASDLLNSIIGINQKQDAATTQAISAFAAALGGTPLKTGGGGG